jgi:peptidoglycan-associated lipoprotein
MAALALALSATLLAGCASTTDLHENLPPPVITRTPESTVWATPESLAAQAAQAAAAKAAAEAARTPRARPSPAPQPAAPPPAVVPGHVPAAAAAPAAFTVYFDFDSAEIKDEFKGLIDGQAGALAANPGRHLALEGHADDRGGHEYNLALGQRRADAVLKAIGQHGVPATQLEAVSFGDTHPAVEGRNEEAWAKNRRVELKDR